MTTPDPAPEAMHDAGRYPQRRYSLAINFNHACHAMRRRFRPGIVEPGGTPAAQNHQIVGVLIVDMNAAEHIGVGKSRVPLARLNADRPLLPVNFGQPAPLIAVHCERDYLHFVWQTRHLRPQFKVGCFKTFS